jgi:hypothetical protein
MAEVEAALVDTAEPDSAVLAATLCADAALDTADEATVACDRFVDAATLGRKVPRLPALAARRRGAVGARLSGVLGMGATLRVQRSRRR